LLEGCSQVQLGNNVTIRLLGTSYEVPSGK